MTSIVTHRVVILVASIVLMASLMEAAPGDFEFDNHVVRTRTTWPTETGTMVRILKKRNGGLINNNVSEDSNKDMEDLVFTALLAEWALKDFIDLASSTYNLESLDSARMKRDIFLRTSRGGPTTNKAAERNENPIFFRAS